MQAFSQSLVKCQVINNHYFFVFDFEMEETMQAQYESHPAGTMLGSTSYY